MSKKYVVQVPIMEEGNTYFKGWEDDSEYNTYEEAKKKAIELVGQDDYYSEPIEEHKLDIPEAPFEWNGYTYENKETGEKRDSKNIKLFQLSEGYFSKKSSNLWECRIIVKQ